MSRQGLPLQEEQLPDSSLQEQQSSQYQQRGENLSQPWQDEARSLPFPQQQETRPYEGANQQASGQYMQGYNIEPQNLSQQVTYNQQSQRQMLQALSKKDKVPHNKVPVNLDQQSIQSSNQRSYMEQQRRQDKSQPSATQSYSQYQISQRLQQQQQLEPFQQQGKKDQQQKSCDQSLQARNQRPYRKQQRHQDKSQQSATQSHPQHQISQRGSKNLSQPWQDEARRFNQQEQYSEQQQQRRSFQQYQGKKNQQRSWNQPIQASNQWSYREQQRRQNKSQQSATQSYPQHQILERGSENLPQPWQDEARSLNRQEQYSQQQQQRRQNKSQQSATQSYPQHQISERGSENLPQPWQDEARSLNRQEQYSQQQRRQNKSQQSATQSYSQHQISQRLQQELSSFQPQGRKDQQQQQITPDTLATLSQLTLKGTRELDMASSTMKDCQARIPKRQRKQPSSETAFIKVNTNMFKIIFKNNFLKKAVHYDVDITIEQLKVKPKVQTTSNRFSKALCREVFEKCRKQHFEKRYPAFDGRKNAYSAYDLPFESNILETTVEIPKCKKLNKPNECKIHLRKFIIVLKKVAEIDLSWTRNLPSSLDEVDGYQTGIQVLDIIMRHEPESQHINVGRSFFWQDNTDVNLSKVLRAVRGGFLSVILGQQIYLNVDVVHKAFFISQEVDELYKNYHNDTIKNLLKDLKVIYQIPNACALSYRLNESNPLGSIPNEQKFVNKNLETISVTDHFRRCYNYCLRQSTLPCLVVKGQRERRPYLPSELCTIESGQSVKKLNDEETSKMIKIAVMSDRKEEIKEVFGKLVNDNSKIMKHEFQLSVEIEMETVNAKILNAPDIIYADNIKVNVNKGTWQMHKFKQPIRLEENQWTILCIRDNKDKDTKNCINIFERMKQFMNKLINQTLNVGMHIGTTNTKTFQYFEKESINIKKYFQKNKEFKLIIVIIPNSPGTIYNEIKQIAELELGILTQCIKFSNFNNVFSNKEKSIIRNILLKINTKLNGINHALDPRPKCFEKICMFVGADVTHPSYDEGKPSIAAVTASNDIDGFQYNVIHKVLPSKQEIIMDLKNIIDVQLSIYKDKTSRLPERIIYYRDGVSEGQLPQVMHYEIEAIRDAYKNKYKSDIEITCLVVQKRHHVRLFPTSSEQTYEKNKNVQAGTIVDSEITHPSHFDFYLVSHASIQGTARPTKYKCICNDSNFTENEIEELTYYLCHMYARCTRTVSYPVPTYYAHLAAYRGKVLLHGYSDNDDRLREIQERFNTKMANLPMYFV